MKKTLRTAPAPKKNGPNADAARVRDRFERLLSAGVEIFSHHTLTAVLQQVVDAAREVVGARYAALGVLAPDASSLSEFVTSGARKSARCPWGTASWAWSSAGPNRYGFPTSTSTRSRLASPNITPP
jgi:hypothetical protein